MKRLKLGIIGVGHLGRIHARLATQLPGTRLVGVADPSRQAREHVAAHCGTEAFASYLDLASRIDAAIVATPTSQHYQVATDLANRGVHLLIEKPMTSSVSEADRLLMHCRRNGLVLRVGHVERYNPALREALPDLAGPKYIEATRTSGYPFRSTDIGVVFDLMIHDLDVVLTLVRSTLTHVEALGVSVLGEQEDAAQARLTFENGCVVNLTASRISYRVERTMQVWTPRGFTALDFASREVTRVVPSPMVTRREFDERTLSSKEKEHLKEHLFDQLLAKETRCADKVNAIALEQRDFVMSIRSGRTLGVTGEQGRAAVEAAERVVQSIARHAWDGRRKAGRFGPLAIPAIVPGPYRNAPPRRRQAG